MDLHCAFLGQSVERQAVAPEGKANAQGAAVWRVQKEQRNLAFEERIQAGSKLFRSRRWIPILREADLTQLAIGNTRLQSVGCRGFVGRLCLNRDDQPCVASVPLARMFPEVHPAVEILVIDSDISRVQKKQAAMHGGGVVLRNVRGGSKPFKIGNTLAIDFGMNECA